MNVGRTRTSSESVESDVGSRQSGGASEPFHSGRYTTILAIAWSVVAGASLVWTLTENDRAIHDVARSQARAAFERDRLYRQWNSSHGGVYVPVSGKAVSNAGLSVPERDVETIQGQRLTLINPAYMTRQVHELGAASNGVQGHITSLRPIRPDNRPDPWETKALQAFESGSPEYSSIESFRGEPHMRLMRPLRTEASCLRCHEHQGYREGDVRGGISISVPMSPLWAIASNSRRSAAIWHGMIWCVGLVGIGVFSRHLARHARQIADGEERILRSEAEFLQTLHASEDAILLIDGTKFVDCNEATVRMLGCSSRDEILLSHPSVLSPPEQPDGISSAAKAEEMIQAALEHGSHRFEWVHRKATGADFPVEVTLTPITYHGQTILHCLWRDLTEEKQLKAERDRSRATMERILESMPVGVVVVSREKAIRHINSAALAMMGYDSESEVSGHLCQMVLCPAQACSCPILDLGLEIDNAERVVIDRSGRRIPVLKTVVPITLNGEDVLLETFVDISERKAAESQLRKLSSAIEQNPASVLITNAAGVIEYVNPGFTRATGYEASEVLGATPRVLQSGQHSAEFYAQMWSVLQRREVWRGEICNRHKGGDLFWVDATIAPVVDETNTISHFVAINVDITQRMQMERDLRVAKEGAEAANQAKSQFLASMSHELRTPLTGILGFADLLLTTPASDEVRVEYLETICSSGRHLLELINDILDLSKIEAGQMRVERAPCAPHEILNDVVSIMRAQAQGKGLELQCRWQGSVPDSIETDGARLRQAVLNLVSNAVKFTQHGAVDITARLDCSEQRNQLSIQVTDSGIGIAPDKLESIFEPFVQADSSVTRNYGGTGLGLAISRRLVRAMGGDISVSSEPGVGSTFTLTVDAGDMIDVPQRAAPLADAIDPREPGQERWSDIFFRAARALLVEDGEINRRLISTVLEQVGLTVSNAENGMVGVDMATRNHFDVVLMDMQMPVLDGYIASRKLRTLGFTRPIIALTAHAMEGDELKCLEAGCSHYVSKPIDIHTLLVTLAEALGEKAIRSTGVRSASQPLPAADSLSLVSSLPIEEPIFREIACDFVEYVEKLLVDMRQAVVVKDMDRLVEMAHSLKGSAGTAGFRAFTEPARRVEMLARQRRLDALGPAVEELARLVDQIVIPSEPSSRALAP